MDVSLLLGDASTVDAKCVVCCLTLGMGGGRRFCKELLHNGNIGEFLVKLDVLCVGGVSLSSPICDNCCYFVDTADRAWTIVADAVKMLKGRRSSVDDARIEVKLLSASVHTTPAKTQAKPTAASGSSSDTIANTNMDVVGSTTPVVARTTPKAPREQKVPPVKVKVREGTGVVVVGAVTATKSSKRRECPTCLQVFPCYDAKTRKRFARHVARHETKSRKMGAGSVTVAEPKSEQKTKEGGKTGTTKASIPSATFNGEGVSDLTACRFCDKSFSSRRNRIRHERIYHKDADISSEAFCPFSCGTCQRRFPTEASSKGHKCNAQPAPPAATIPRLIIVKCKICQKNIRQSRLRVHLKTAHNKVLSADGKRITSVKTVADRPPCVCSACGKITSTSWNLRQHMRAFHGVEAEQANVVVEPVKAESSVRLSIVNCVGAGETPDETSGIHVKNRKTFKCPVCALVHYTAYALQNHINNEHAGNALHRLEDDFEEVELDVEDGRSVDFEGSMGGNVAVGEAGNVIDLEAEDTDMASSVASETRSYGDISNASGSTAELKFCCPVCCRGFYKKIDRRRHIEREHSDACLCCGNMWNLSVGEEQVVGLCEVCSVEVPHLNAHKIYNHKALYCQTCWTAFAQRAALSKHLETCGVEDGVTEGSSVLQDNEPAGDEDNSVPTYSRSVIDTEVNGTFVCKVCTFQSDLYEQCVKHLKSHYQCVKCLEWFSTNPIFREHLKSCASPRK